jgi:hypothetical protein
VIRTLLAYFFALWHLRRMPPPRTSEARRERQRWCRDHCGDFAGRWFAVAAGLWLYLGLALRPASAGATIAWVAALALVAFCLGLWHLIWQVLAQARAGPPRIDPPVDPTPRRNRHGRRF